MLRDELPLTGEVQKQFDEVLGYAMHRFSMTADDLESFTEDFLDDRPSL